MAPGVPASVEVRAVAGADPLFPCEEEMRVAQDLLFFAYRDFTAVADAVLVNLGLGRAHHRALHFIGRNPAISVSELLAILRITKQSLGRVLSILVARGYVDQVPGQADRRQRRLTLTTAGLALERELFERQRVQLAAAYRGADDAAIAGFHRVMRGIMGEAARTYLEEREAARAEARTRSL